MNNEISILEKLFFAYGDSKGKEKIMIGDGNGIHYTLVYKANEKIIDFHKTNDFGKTYEEKYTSIFKSNCFML